jgi:hypothetical protein
MVGSNLTILDQIAKFFLLLSDVPSYWFTLNISCGDHAFHLSKRLGMDKSDYKALLIAGNLARFTGGGIYHPGRCVEIISCWASYIHGLAI